MNPVGPASYATRVGPGNPAQNAHDLPRPARQALRAHLARLAINRHRDAPSPRAHPDQPSCEPSPCRHPHDCGRGPGQPSALNPRTSCAGADLHTPNGRKNGRPYGLAWSGDARAQGAAELLGGHAPTERLERAPSRRAAGRSRQSPGRPARRGGGTWRPGRAALSRRRELPASAGPPCRSSARTRRRAARRALGVAGPRAGRRGAARHGGARSQVLGDERHQRRRGVLLDRALEQPRREKLAILIIRTSPVEMSEDELKMIAASVRAGTVGQQLMRPSVDLARDEHQRLVGDRRDLLRHEPKEAQRAQRHREAQPVPGPALVENQRTVAVRQREARPQILDRDAVREPLATPARPGLSPRSPGSWRLRAVSRHPARGQATAQRPLPRFQCEEVIGSRP